MKVPVGIQCQRKQIRLRLEAAPKRIWSETGRTSMEQILNEQTRQRSRIRTVQSGRMRFLQGQSNVRTVHR